MLRFISALGLIAALAGCQSAYYSTLESFGVQKREILVDRIADAKESQEDAKEQFSSALEQFKSVVAFDGGDLEDLYEDLADELDSSESQAEEVSDRIESVRDVAEALFKEWEEELEQYQDGSLKAQSRRQLTDTRSRYGQLIRAMERAEARIEPVLGTFRDQVLFLKHNLNARAVASLRSEVDNVQTDIDALIADMEKSIDEASAFIQTMTG